MFWFLLVLTGVAWLLYPQLLFAVYAVSYALYHRFSKAHLKPTSDDTYHVPQREHETHPLTRTVRHLERMLAKVDPIPQNTVGVLRPIPCPELPASSGYRLHQAFHTASVHKQSPVVLRGLLRDTPAVKQWSAEFFQAKHGASEVLVLDKGQTRGNAYTSFNQALNLQHMPLGETIAHMTDAVKQRDRPLYINNVTDFFMQCPDLIPMLDLDTLAKRVDTGISANTWLKVNLFMGGRNTGSSLHCAAGGNYFCNIVGRKRWTLIHPQYSHLLKSTPSKDFAFVISGYDLNNRQHATLRQLPRYEVTLEPGDVLYVPPWWWHHVTNVSDFSIGCAVRDHTAYAQTWRNNPLYMALSPYWYRLHPWILWAVEKLKGRDYMLKHSMASDAYIMESLSGKRF